ncbi:methylmalonyl Co-A mutase-associated GTPase MeaB [Chloroflexota bacterium]
MLDGKRLALARLLTQIENQTTAGQEALAELFPHTGKAMLVGVTGAPGTGKSSLVNQIAYHYRQGDAPKRVAVVAVDPSSPFSGGAVLGDRIRMTALSGDPDVFIRSMASRGSLGGLAKATAGVVQAFDAAGYEVILIETVGAGQAEVDIARLAHTTLVVEAPGLGDDIQAIKAGILEIADILVVNKGDRQGAENTVRVLQNMLQLANPVRRVFQDFGQGEVEEEEEAWQPPIQRTVATDGEGVPELVELIAEHHAHLVESGDLTRRVRARLAAELDQQLQEVLVGRFCEKLADGAYEKTLTRLVARELSPQAAVRTLLNGAEG